MNNAVFGKTMENVKNRMQVHLTTDHDNAVKWFSKVNFKDSKYFEGLHMIEMYKTEIEYDKPVYAGTSILDLSTLCMMEFHYNTIQKHFPGHYNLVIQTQIPWSITFSTKTFMTGSSKTSNTLTCQIPPDQT